MSIVDSHMSYLEPWVDKEESPYVRGKVEEGFPRTNFVNQEYTVQIQDARHEKNNFNLDTHGFAFHDIEPLSDGVTQAIRTRNKADVERLYYPQVESFLKNTTGASKVVIFDHTYRKRDPSLGPDENPDGKEQPATLVHCDQGPLGAVRRVQRHTGDDAESLLKNRAQIIK